MTESRLPCRPLELWAGTECTVNRIGDQFIDQLERTGHDRRIDDLDRFADLGIRTLRYPILWERTAPQGLDGADWAWADHRLDRLRALGVRPIVGLVHHGSGPSYTNLLDPAWPELLAEYAESVAIRYPWIDAYTPVNEPLTTARFSALYGHWYPHVADDRAFARALLHQLKGTVLAMRAIRSVNPNAILVQTEDLTYVRASPHLAYQANFENERRWLTFDVLNGRVTGDHPMAHYFRWLGVSESELEWFALNTCPAQIVGLNYYVVSERFLDGCSEAGGHGPGNGRDRYLDVEAVRMCGLEGIQTLLGQAWQRFETPLAITEAHLGGTRDEQLRWLMDIWDGAEAARISGVGVTAVTAWSLLGAFDWDTLCVAQRGHYEAGAFDIRGGIPRPTALAKAIRELAAGRRPNHPVLAAPGWWRR